MKLDDLLLLLAIGCLDLSDLKSFNSSTIICYENLMDCYLGTTSLILLECSEYLSKLSAYTVPLREDSPLFLETHSRFHLRLFLSFMISNWDLSIL
jgi:hypothetical protein